jgi:Domain of unknown function (DUF222)
MRRPVATICSRLSTASTYSVTQFPHCVGEELLDTICGIEVLARKMQATMLELVAGLDASRVAGEQGFGTTGKLLAAMLDLSADQARARTRAVEQLGTRRAMTGEPLAPQLPATISQHDRDWAEATLAEHAQNFDPRRLAVIARRVLDKLHPDGPQPTEPEHPCPPQVSCTSATAATAVSTSTAGLTHCSAPRCAP